MKIQHLLLFPALTCLLAVSCHKNEPQPAGPGGQPQGSAEAKLRDACGFAAQTPKDEEAFVALYGLKKLWQDFKQTKTAQSLRANPAIQHRLASPVLQQMLGKVSSNPDTAKLRTILGDVLGKEAFVIFAPGSAEKFRALQNFTNEMRVRQVKDLLSGTASHAQSNSMKGYLTAFQANGKSLEIPPMIFGGKISAQKADLIGAIAQLEKKLPAGVESTAFNLGGSIPFKSLVFSASKLVPREKLDQFRKMLETQAGDAQVADEVFQSLVGRKLEIAYGFEGDYFLVSIGPDHSHLKLAANYGDSLLSLPEMNVGAQYAGKSLISFSWCSKTWGEFALPHYQLTPWYQRFKQEISGVVSADDLKKLGEDIGRIDAKGGQIFPKDVSPAVGFAYREHGIHGEVYGGVKMPALDASKPMKFSGVPADSTFFWLDAERNPVITLAAWAWLEDMVTTGYDLFQRYGIPRLPDQQRIGFGVIQNLAVPKLVELYHITRNQLAKSLGDEAALAVDLNGEIPALPMLPSQIMDRGRLVRLAYIRDVQDRKLLGESWDSYFKLGRDIALMIPKLSQIPGGLPAPQIETVGGVALSYYPLPIPTGDFLPNIATTDNTLVASTSRSYSLDLAKRAATPMAGAKPMAMDLRINISVACDFANRWVTLAGENPDLFFPGKPDQGAQFRARQPNVSALLQSLHAIRELDVQVYEENGMRRVSSKIGWQE